MALLPAYNCRSRFTRLVSGVEESLSRMDPDRPLPRCCLARTEVHEKSPGLLTTVIPGRLQPRTRRLVSIYVHRGMCVCMCVWGGHSMYV